MRNDEEAYVEIAKMHRIIMSHDKERRALREELNVMKHALGRLINLTSHPYFPDVKDLPAWQEAITEARTLVKANR